MQLKIVHARTEKELYSFDVEETDTIASVKNRIHQKKIDPWCKCDILKDEKCYPSRQGLRTSPRCVLLGEDTRLEDIDWKEGGGEKGLLYFKDLGPQVSCIPQDGKCYPSRQGLRTSPRCVLLGEDTRLEDIDWKEGGGEKGLLYFKDLGPQVSCIPQDGKCYPSRQGLRTSPRCVLLGEDTRLEDIDWKEGGGEKGLLYFKDLGPQVSCIPQDGKCYPSRQGLRTSPRCVLLGEDTRLEDIDWKEGGGEKGLLYFKDLGPQVSCIPQDGKCYPSRQGLRTSPRCVLLGEDTRLEDIDWKEGGGEKGLLYFKDLGPQVSCIPQDGKCYPSRQGLRTSPRCVLLGEDTRLEDIDWKEGGGEKGLLYFKDLGPQVSCIPQDGKCYPSRQGLRTSPRCVLLGEDTRLEDIDWKEGGGEKGLLYFKDLGPQVSCIPQDGKCYPSRQGLRTSPRCVLLGEDTRLEDIDWKEGGGEKGLLYFKDLGPQVSCIPQDGKCYPSRQGLRTSPRCVLLGEDTRLEDIDWKEGGGEKGLLYFKDLGPQVSCIPQDGKCYPSRQGLRTSPRCVLLGEDTRLEDIDWKEGGGEKGLLYFKDLGPQVSCIPQDGKCYPSRQGLRTSPRCVLLGEDTRLEDIDWKEGGGEKGLLYFKDLGPQVSCIPQDGKCYPSRQGLRTSPRCVLLGEDTRLEDIDWKEGGGEKGLLYFKDLGPQVSCIPQDGKCYPSRQGLRTSPRCVLLGEDTRLEDIDWKEGGGEKGLLYFKDLGPQVSCIPQDGKCYPSRQGLRTSPRCVLLGEDTRLEDIDWKEGGGEKGLLYFKDLGPQIGWKTVFVVEYLGPLLIFPVFYTRPWLIYGDSTGKPLAPVVTLATVCWCVHYGKRLLETLFVHRFSKGTMPLFNIFKNSGYYWGFAAYVAFFVCHPLYTPPSYGNVQVYGALAVFAVAELGNLSIHLALRDLRPAGSKVRRIPRATANPFTCLFNFVSCPNYTYETLIWISFAVMTQTLTGGLFCVVGFLQMAAWAQNKHCNYRLEFEKYPKNRKAIIPFLL